MQTRVTCSHCHTLNAAGDSHCVGCGHRADLPRLACDCGRCAGPRIDLNGLTMAECEEIDRQMSGEE